MAVFDRGDIIVVNLEPVVGREMQGERRPALVLTTKEFNALGDVLIAASLMNTGCKTQGVALVNKCRMMDLTARKAKKIERAPQAVIDDALGRLMALFE